MSLMFGLIVVGSIVRTTGSGLACPDWPLCEGRLIPRLELHVLVEWGHRLLALLVSLLLFVTGTWVFAQRPVRARLGGLMGLAIGLLFVQVLLGALTVWKLLSPAVVSSHLATGLLLFATLLTIALIAEREAAEPPHESAARPAGLLPLFAFATLLIYAQAVLGGVVSTNGAGLACPDWPKCRGEWFPPLQGLVGMHMVHRWTAYALGLLLIVLAWRARSAANRRVARTARLLLGLAFVQMLVGILNLSFGIRVELSALHLAIAAGLLALSIVATFRLATLTAPHPALVAKAIPTPMSVPK